MDRTLRTPAPASSGVVRAGFLVLPATLLALAFLLPSRDVHGDAFDELLCVESAHCPPSPKHPATEPVVWALMRVLRGIGFAGRAIRPVQLWNATWMCLALVALWGFIRRTSGSDGVALACTLVAGGSYAWVHLNLDPYLFYWPPGVALLFTGAWLAVTSASVARGWPRLAVAVACLVAALLFNPMCAAALGGVVSSARHRGLSRVRSIAVFLAPGVVIAWVMLAFAGHSTEGLYGHWRPEVWRSAVFGAWHALMPHTYHLEGSPWQPEGALLARVAGGALIIAAVALVLDFAGSGRAGLRAAAVWLLTAAGSALFVAWWDPEQGQFWLLPLLSLLAAWAESRRAVPPIGRARWTARWIGVQGVLLLLSSTIGYGLPAGTTKVDHEAAARRMAVHFHPTDILVYPGFSDPYLTYYAGLTGRCLVDFFFVSRSSPAQGSTLDVLGRFVADSRAEGRRVFLAMGGDGQPEIPDWVLKAGVDYRLQDFQRIRWGETVVAEGQVFREVRAIPPKS